MASAFRKRRRVQSFSLIAVPSFPTMYAVAVAIDTAFFRILGTEADVLPMTRPINAWRRTVATEISRPVAEQAKARIGIADDSAGELGLFEIQMAGGAIDVAMRPGGEIFHYVGVTIVAFKNRRMLERPWLVLVDSADVAIPAAMDRRMQPCRPYIPVHEKRLMRAVTTGAAGRPVLDAHKFVVLKPGDLWKVPRTGGQRAVACKTGFPAVGYRHERLFRVLNVLPCGPVAGFALHRYMDVLVVQRYLVFMAHLADFDPDMPGGELKGVIDGGRSVESGLTERVGSHRNPYRRRGQKEDHQDGKQEECVSITGLAGCRFIVGCLFWHNRLLCQIDTRMFELSQ